MNFPTYSQMRSWRDVCEFLDSVKYKFAEPESIRNHCPKALPAIFNPRIREHRKFLYENYLVQFVTWQQHPYLSFSHSRSVYRELKDLWGWRLVSDWESKIDYLEKVVLFGNEPDIKPWEPALRQRIYQREQRRQKQELALKLAQMNHDDRLAHAAQLGICWRCLTPIIPLMVDCVGCGAKQ
jgi:hypothetical protein